MAQGSSQSQATSSSTTSHLSVMAPGGSVVATTGMRSRRIDEGGNSSSGGMGGSDGGFGAKNNILRFYTDDAPGLKISPTVMLFMSLYFIGFVTTLHVFSKLYLHRSTGGA
ncbi:putative protein transport protein SecG/Sec61-beta/Sbh [Rosa chinensis]|uniref:Protein transport protein Sec61 subunit beta n=1 Tax=Rosa chinensis TaxID=74649 RepID=A0A2P6QN01_ROSCH|nr:protein transport protein Sec61 subunit beta [Rosa chinensis]PRQ35562.1 putative protein transport protein SecG/Sec61-beta/Sbh [Rosa chinensis]